MREPSLRTKIAVNLASVVFGLAIIGAAIYWQAGSEPRSAERSGNSDTGSSSDTGERTFTLEELAQHDGLSGNDCYVAVDGNVYLIEGFPLWQMGQHIPSKGKASCGRDLTSVIDESPHGRSKLQLLKKVGTLE